MSGSCDDGEDSCVNEFWPGGGCGMISHWTLTRMWSAPLHDGTSCETSRGSRPAAESTVVSSGVVAALFCVEKEYMFATPPLADVVIPEVLHCNL